MYGELKLTSLLLRRKDVLAKTQMNTSPSQGPFVFDTGS
jgi:hypothetical protein